MVKIESQGEYLNARAVIESDIVEITGEGEYKQVMKFGKQKNELYLPVAVNSTKKLQWNPSNTSLKILVEKWGDDTAAWIGKKFQCKIVLMNIAGKEVSSIRPLPL